MNDLHEFLSTINGIIWHDSVLFVLLGTGVLFTVWSGFSQYRALTHGFHVIRGSYDNPDDPGAINHFQALTTALSATVGLGNIGGVAIAIALGGPGAVFWMWVVGFFGMAIKLTEVTLSMLYRNVEDPDNPHGGPMWVVSKGLAKKGAALGNLGKGVAVVFCITALISAATGGNMFQAWNAGEITELYFGIPSVITGIVLAILVGLVIIGRIKRIGAVTGRLVPIMLLLYLLAGLYVVGVNIDRVPEMFRLIFKAAFSPVEASGAFIGGTMGYAFLFGMKRALFSNEAGQGTSPMAHSAAKTDEPVREGIVAGLEPFIDTIVVCTLTSLVILSTGVWERESVTNLSEPPQILEVPDGWTMETTQVPPEQTVEWNSGESVFIILSAHDNPSSGNRLHRLYGNITFGSNQQALIEWDVLQSPEKPRADDLGIYKSYVGATLTARAFDSVLPGLGKWLVTISVWLFALSTMISWSYYGEQATVYLFGDRGVLAYKALFCALIVVATLGFIETDVQLDNLTGFGTGVMLLVNVPIMWIFGRQTMLAYKEYVARLKTGQMGQGHSIPSREKLISDRDVE